MHESTWEKGKLSRELAEDRQQTLDVSETADGKAGSHVHLSPPHRGTTVRCGRKTRYSHAPA
jgi:hypothetical protein